MGRVAPGRPAPRRMLVRFSASERLGLGDGPARLLHLARGREPGLLGADHLGGHPVLDLHQLQGRRPLLGGPLLGDGAVGEARGSGAPSRG